MNIAALALTSVILISIAAIIAKISSRKIYIIIKPLPLLILFLLLMYSKIMSANVPFWFLLIMFGLGFGFLGDLFLLGKKKVLAAGIISFVFGHICYIIAFNVMAKHIIILSFIPVLPALLYLHYIKKHISEAKRAVLYAILPYFGVIVIMCISAFNVDFSENRFPMYGLAGLLFCISDALLIWGSFIKSNRFLQALVLICYYPAQIIFAFYTLSFFK